MPSHLKRTSGRLLVVLLGLVAGSGATAQESGEIQVGVGRSSTWQQSVRENLNERGIYLSLVYTGDALAALKGGARRGVTGLGVADVIGLVELEPLLGWRNASLGIDLVGIHGGNPGAYAGDLQGVSNIAAPNALRLYECWLQQHLFADRLSVLLGVYDVNTSFDVIETAALLINASGGMGPEFSTSGCNGAPTYPYPALGVRLGTRLSERLSLQVALTDGVPGDPGDPDASCYRLDSREGFLLCTELSHVTGSEQLTLFPPVSRRILNRRRRIGFPLGRRWGTEGNQGAGRGRGPGWGWGRIRGGLEDPGIEVPAETYGKIALGLWRSTTDFTVATDGGDPPDGRPEQGTWGGYLLAERILFVNPSDPGEYLSGFVRAGFADRRVNPVDAYLGLGIVCTRSFIRHYQDQIGLGIMAAHAGDAITATAGAGEGAHAWEIACELSYRAQVNAWFALQPDLQYIIHPGFDPALRNALIIGVRMELAL